MTLSELIADGGLTFLGVALALLALGLLVGAALGYFTASTDLDRERAKAWDRGAADATVTPLGKPIRNPYRKTSLAPEPPHYVVPNPPVLNECSCDHPLVVRKFGTGHAMCQRCWRPIPSRGVLFDQDAPTERARAIELRGDD